MRRRYRRAAPASTRIPSNEATSRCSGASFEGMLAGAGHRVPVAADDEEALRVVSAAPARPGLRGTALAEALSGQRPGIRVRPASGYTEGDLGLRDPGSAPMACLAKPSTTVRLRAAVASNLGRS